MGCLVDILVALVVFVLVALVAGDYHHENGSVSINLTTGPTLVFIALMLLYYLGYRRPAKANRKR
jgi:hypothetical protein